MNEEIVARFGSNTTGFQQGLDAMKRGTAQAGEHAHKSFVHAGNGAREFHKLLHGIGEQAPIMGGLLRTAISPIGGAFFAAGLVITKVTESLKEMNQQFYEIGRSAESPFYKVASLVRAAHREAVKFNEEFSFWKHKPEKDKELEFLEEKLALIKLQAAEAAKLSPGKANAIEKASTQLQFDLQGRALQSVAGKVGSSEGAADQAAAAYGAALNDPTASKARALIKVDEELSTQMREAIRKLGAQRDELTTGGMFGDQIIIAKINEKLLGIKEKLSAAEKRIDINNETIDRETERRKSLADKLAEAKGVHEEYKQQFNALSKTLESTRQHLSILTGVANPEHEAIAPSTVRAGIWSRNNAQFASDTWNFNREKSEQDWRRTHGLSWHDVTAPVNANQTQDKVQNDIAALNELFHGITTSDGMKVTFTIKDD